MHRLRTGTAVDGSRLLRADGLFRLSADAEERDALQRQLDGPTPAEAVMACTDPHVLAGCLKLYYRKLPEPLVSSSCYAAAISLGHALQPSAAPAAHEVRKLGELIHSRLDETSQSCLHALLAFLYEVRRHPSFRWCGEAADVRSVTLACAAPREPCGSTHTLHRLDPRYAHTKTPRTVTLTSHAAILSGEHTRRCHEDGGRQSGACLRAKSHPRRSELGRCLSSLCPRRRRARRSGMTRLWGSLRSPRSSYATTYSVLRTARSSVHCSYLFAVPLSPLAMPPTPHAPTHRRRSLGAMTRYT